MAKSFNQRMRDRFATITTNGDKLNLYVHETAVMIAEHALEHGDCSTAQGLVMAMPASMRREMLILWFKKFTPIVVKNDDKWASQMHKEGTKLFVPFNIDDGKATPFYRLAEQNPEAKFRSIEDLEKLLPSLVARIRKDIENGKVASDAVDYAEAIASAVAKVKVKRPVASNDQDDEKAVA